MTDSEIKTDNTDYERKETKANYSDFCTNPITPSEEVYKYSWLDDFGWI